MKEQNYMKLEFPSRSVNEGFSRAAVAAFAAQLDMTLTEMGDLKTAVSEAVTNCAVQDRGRGIQDVARAREPMFTTGGEERSGMGFTIMESFTDSLKVRSRPGQGTTVTMRKRVGKRVTGR